MKKEVKDGLTFATVVIGSVAGFFILMPIIVLSIVKYLVFLHNLFGIFQ